MQLKNSVWIVGVVVLAGTLAYIKWEMARNREMLSKEMDNAVADAPAKMAAAATKKVTHMLITNPPAASQPDAAPSQPPDSLGGLLDLAAKTGQRATQLLNTNPPAPGQPGQPAPAQDPVGTLLDLAAKTGQRIDQMGLKSTEMSDEEEMALGEQLDREILRGMPEANDPKSLARLESLAKPLIDQCQRKLILYKIRIVKSSKINAFGCAGGHVYVTTAFLKRFTTDEELAMTLGHEIAHVELKHAVHKVQYLYRTRKTLGEAANIGQLAYALLGAPYTKDQEFEADAVGFDACRKAGWESAKLLALYEGFIQLEQEQAKSRGGGATETGSDLERKAGDYFSTHPGTAERLARLKARASA